MNGKERSRRSDALEEAEFRRSLNAAGIFSARISYSQVHRHIR